MSDPAAKAMSVEEYLRTEEKSPYKREYVGGFVYPLHAHAGASRPHVLICMNIAGTLYPDAARTGCRLYQNDMKLRVEDSASFFSPDVMLVCDKGSGDNDAETSPCLLVEVLSQSTASHDRFGKYGVYTAIPSLQTYLIVEQKERRVYAYGRVGVAGPQRQRHGAYSLPGPHPHAGRDLPGRAGGTVNPSSTAHRARRVLPCPGVKWGEQRCAPSGQCTERPVG